MCTLARRSTHPLTVERVSTHFEIGIRDISVGNFDVVNNRRLVLHTRAGHIEVRCLLTGLLLFSIQHLYRIQCMTLVPQKGGLLVTGDEKGFIDLWDIDKGE